MGDNFSMILEIQYLSNCTIKSQVLIFQLICLISSIEKDTSIRSFAEVLEMTFIASKKGVLDLCEIVRYEMCCISQKKSPIKDAQDFFAD